MGKLTRIGGVVAASLWSAGPVAAQQPRLETCSEVHAYCLQLCGNGVPTPPVDWKCEVNRCIGLEECLRTGSYRMGTQFGHRAPRRTEWGPFEKK